jgi:hypothetical protein
MTSEISREQLALQDVWGAGVEDTLREFEGKEINIKKNYQIIQTARRLVGNRVTKAAYREGEEIAEAMINADRKYGRRR